MREIKFRSVLEFEDGFKLMINPVAVYPDMVGFSYDLISEALEETKYTLEGDGIYWADEDHYDKMYDLIEGEDWYWAEDVEPMQYTGLKDKNGKEIYEADKILMDFSDKEKIVIFDNQMASFRIQSHVKHYDGTFKTHGFEETESYELEIIGNIHENPELIK